MRFLYPRLPLAPAVSLMILIAVLPNVGETIYSPSLPHLAQDFGVTNNQAETTLTIYLLGYAAGILAWGGISDLLGRRPVMLLGILLYTLGTLGCLFSKDFHFLNI